MKAHKRTLFGFICLALVLAILPIVLTGAVTQGGRNEME